MPHHVVEPESAVAQRRAERELLFWTLRQILIITLMGALTIYTVVSLIRGEHLLLEQMMRSLSGS